MDWDAFTAWLEADARHRREYDNITLLNDELDDHRATLASLTAPIPERRRKSRRVYAGIAAALILLLTIVILPLLHTGARSDMIYRAPGNKNRTIALNDTQIELGAGSMLTEVGGDAQHLKLDGVGYFVVPHRPGRTLKIVTGDFTVSDIGTRFEIFSTADSLRVAVASGAVSVTSAALTTPVSIGGGQRLTVVKSSDLAELGTIHAGDVASWRNGQLIYDQAPLSLVAAEVSRYGGQPVTIDPDLANRRFSGTLTIGDGSDLAHKLAEAEGLRLENKDGVLRLGDSGGG